MLATTGSSDPSLPSAPLRVAENEKVWDTGERCRQRPLCESYLRFGIYVLCVFQWGEILPSIGVTSLVLKYSFRWRNLNKPKGSWPTEEILRSLPEDNTRKIRASYVADRTNETWGLTKKYIPRYRVALKQWLSNDMYLYARTFLRTAVQLVLSWQAHFVVWA